MSAPRATPNVLTNGSDEEATMNTIIIGAGQAGLSTAYHLLRLGQECLVLDARQRIGDSWRRQWDSLRLFTPARYNGLPGLPFPGDKWAYPGKDEMGDYLQSYAEYFELPVRSGIAVDRVIRDRGRYAVHAGDQRFDADNVVIATSSCGAPNIPDFARDLDPGIRQLHSSRYRRPEQLTDGPVLVVGAAHSGADIAFEVAATHQTVLCRRDTGQMPVRVTNSRATPLTRTIMPLGWFVQNHVATINTPLGRKLKPLVRSHGGPLLRVKRADLAAAGVERVFVRATGVSDGKPMLADGRVLDVTNVVWCTGFRHDYDWIDPLTTDDLAWPRERSGVAIDAPGLYFVGLKFQRSFGSMLVGGVGADAAYLAGHIAPQAALTPRTVPV
jgi:putative flavoprotein involved in K+ transport